MKKAKYLKLWNWLQAAVHSLLQAVQEIAARGEGRDRDVHIFVQRRCVMSDLMDVISQCFNEFYVVFKICVLKNSLKNNHRHCAEAISLLPTKFGWRPKCCRYT